jgi:hypothetical protein
MYVLHKVYMYVYLYIMCYMKSIYVFYIVYVYV